MGERKGKIRGGKGSEGVNEYEKAWQKLKKSGKIDTVFEFLIEWKSYII